MRQETTLRKVFKKLEITQREFARRAEITPPYVQDLMRGRAIPSIDVLKRLVLASEGLITVGEVLRWERAGESQHKSA